MATRRRLSALIGLFGLAACAGPASPPVVGWPTPAAPPQQHGFLYCVPYAREVSGIAIFGDAWTWWEAAAGRYARGSRPTEGAVLVWKRDGRLTDGHVAVVTAVASAREILVTHANWAWAGKPRGQVDRDVSVIDVSPKNDWSAIRVWNGSSYGRIYAAHGFIYPGDGGQAI